MTQSVCPGWEYRDHPDCEQILPDRCHGLLVSLRSGAIDSIDASCNTRPSHQQLFTGLTPNHHPYYAGNYRGEHSHCLVHYFVKVSGDPRVGVDPICVMQAMRYIVQAIGDGVEALDRAFGASDEELPRKYKIDYIVKFSTRILVEFLRVHPYANGNGHMGRFIVFGLLARYGLWPKTWPLDSSPSYGKQIMSYRNGNHKPLEEFVHKALLGI